MFIQIKKELGITSNKEALREILKQKTNPQKVQKIPGENRDNSSKTCSRPIPAQQKRELGDYCVYPDCGNPAEIYHHRERYSENQSHESVVPLCRHHHEYAHNGLIENEQEDPRKWRRKLPNAPTKQSDLLYRKYRQAALL